MLTPYGASFKVNYHDAVFYMKIDNGGFFGFFFLVFGSLKNNLMKVYLVPNSIVNYIKFVFAKFDCYIKWKRSQACTS